MTKRNLLKKGFLTLGIGGILILPIESTLASGNDCIIFDSNSQTILGYSRSLQCSKDVTIPVQIDGVDVRKVGAEAFSFANLKSVTFPTDSKVEVIGEGAFSNNYLTTDLVLPDSIREIHSGAFGGNWFKSVRFGNRLTHLKDYSFSTNSYEHEKGIGEIVLPSSLQEVSWWVFWGTNWTNIVIPDEVYQRTGLFVKDNILYRKVTLNNKEVIAKFEYIGMNKDVYIPNKVTTPDGVELFTSDLGPSSLTGGLTQSNPGDLSEVPYEGRTIANRFVEGTTKINITIDPEYSKRRGYYMHEGLLLTSYHPEKFELTEGERTTNTLPEGDKYYVARTYDLSEELRNNRVIPTTFNGKPIVGLGNGSFWLYGNKKVTLPENLEEVHINSFLFNDLEELVIPASTTKLDVFSLKGNKLKKISWEGHPDGKLPNDWDGKEQYYKEGGVYKKNDDGTWSYYYIADRTNPTILSEINGQPVVEIFGGHIGGSSHAQVRDNKTYTIPGSIKVIKEGAFNATYITDVTLNEGLTEIRARAFSGNDLKFVRLPSTLRKIGSTAFTNNIGVPKAQNLVVGIVPDGFDKNLIENPIDSGLRILTETEARDIIDTTPPDITHTLSRDGILSINGLEPTDIALYNVIDPNESCPTTQREAVARNFKVFNKTSTTVLPEDSNGKKLCILAFDDSFNYTTREELIPNNHIDLTPPKITVKNPTPNVITKSKTYSATTDDPNASIFRALVPQNAVCETIVGEYVMGDHYIAREEDTNKKVCFRAVDQLGNDSFSESDPITEIDSTPPDVTFTNISPDVETLSKQKTVQLNSIEPFKITGLKKIPTNELCTTSNIGEEIPVTEENTRFRDDHTYVADNEDFNNTKLCVTFEDEVGNSGLIETDGIKNIDTTPPTLNISKTNSTLKGTFVDTNLKNDSLRYILDNNPINYTNSETILLTEDMNGKEITFIGEDLAGNTVTKSTLIEGVDTTPPTIRIEENDNPQTIKAIFTDKNPITGTYYFKDEPNNKIPYTSGQAIPLTEDMNGKTLVFEATDDKGNKTTTEIAAPFSGIDTTVPEITLNRVGQTIVPSVKDDNLDPSSLEYYIEGTPSVRYPYENNKPVSLSEDMNGKKLVFVAKDLKKNETSKNTDILSGIDRTNPTIDITVDPKGQTVNAVIKDDNLKPDTVKYYFKDEPNKKVPYTSNKDLPLTEDMNGRTIVFEAEDRDGNKTTKEYPTPFSGIDTTKPTIRLNQTSDSFTPHVLDDNLDEDTLVYYKEGTTEKIPFKNNKKIAITEDMNGKTIIFEAIDKKGNISKVSSTPISGIDNTKPVIKLNQTSDSFTPNVIDDNLDEDTLVYYVEGTTNKVPYRNNEKIPLTEDMNSKKLVFEAKDTKGNTTTITSTLINGVDTTSPSLTINKNNDSISADMEDKSPVTGFYYFKDTPNNKTPYTSGTKIPLTADMEGKVLVFEAVDNKGNKTTKEITLSNIDSIPPKVDIKQDGNSIKLDYDKNGTDNLGNTEVKYYFKDENPVTKKDYKEPFNITSDMNGKTLVIEVTDKYGNKTTKEIVLTYTTPTPTTTSSSRGGSGGGGATIKVQNVDGSVTYYGNNKNKTSNNNTTTTKVEETKNTEPVKSLLDTINKEAGRTYFEFNGGVYSIKETSCNYNFTLSQDTTNGFNDVNYVQSLTDIITKFKNSGIVSGVGNNNFEPLRGITRAEFLSIILRGNCLDEVIGDKEIPFNDVRRDHWHYNVIKKAYNLGIISGYGDGTVRPQQEISRIEALAVMMKVNDLRIDKLTDNFLGHKFTDITEEWQNDLLDKVVFFRMVNDEYMKEFKPNKTILRQEVMKFLYDLFNKYVGNGK